VNQGKLALRVPGGLIQEAPVAEINDLIGVAVDAEDGPFKGGDFGAGVDGAALVVVEGGEDVGRKPAANDEGAEVAEPGVRVRASARSAEKLGTPPLFP